jgi:hypothetical protein
VKLPLAGLATALNLLGNQMSILTHFDTVEVAIHFTQIATSTSLRLKKPGAELAGTVRRATC